MQNGGWLEAGWGMYAVKVVPLQGFPPQVPIIWAGRWLQSYRTSLHPLTQFNEGQLFAVMYLHALL